MIDLKNLKLVLYDFDDTLCIHKCHEDNDDLDHLYNINILVGGLAAFNDGSTSLFMKKFMDVCARMNIRQGLISAALSYKHCEAKNEWVRRNYDINLENFCVGSANGKIDMMTAIADAYCFDKNEILIIDDYWYTLEKASNLGFQACTPMEIVNYISERGFEL